MSWTTTPWTFPANTALCLNADVKYAEIFVDGDTYIIAKDRTLDYFVQGKLLTIKDGSEYAGVAYEPLFTLPAQEGKNRYIAVCDNYVSVEDGTGIVHIAPAFGEDDFRVGQAINLAFYN